MLIAPRIIHRHTQLPIFIFRTYNRNSLLRRSIISISLDTRVDNYILIVRAQQIHDSFRVPCLRRLFPVAIKPIQVRLPSLVQLRQLRHIKIHETFPAHGIIRITHFRTCHVRIIRMRPVQQGIIESHLQSLLADFLYKRTDQIPFSRRTFYRTQLTRLCIP